MLHFSFTSSDNYTISFEFSSDKTRRIFVNHSQCAQKYSLSFFSIDHNAKMIWRNFQRAKNYCAPLEAQLAFSREKLFI